MIWFLKLCVFPLVLMDFQRLLVEAGYTTWKVMEVPIVFGGDVVIQCMYHNNLSCTDHIFWTWTTEPKNDFIMINGTLSEKYKNGKKYSEIRSFCTQYSNLVISNFNEIDYRKKYKCGIANINNPESSFVEYPKEEITFENISYEYTPAQKMVSTVLNLKNQQVSFSLKIDKIYPVPECKAIFADTDVTNALKVQKKKIGLLYNVAFTYTTSDMSMVSIGDLCIRCNGKRSQWKSLHPFCKNKSDLTTERNLVDISPIEDLTTKHNLVDISPVKGLYLAAIVFVGVFYILYPVSVVVVMIRLYNASKDQFDKIKQILSRIESISYLCIGSCLMFGVLSFGGKQIKVRPELPIQLEHGMNIFSLIAMSSPMICGLLIVSVIPFAERKLPEKTWCSMYFILIWMIFPLSSVIMFVCLIIKVTSTMVLDRRYGNAFFFWMPIFDMLLLFFFLYVKHMAMISVEKLHKMRDGRLHRKTGKTKDVYKPFDAERHQPLIDKENSIIPEITDEIHNTIIAERHEHPIDRENSIISEGSESFHTASNSQSDEELSENLESGLTASNRQSDREMSSYV